MRKRANAERTEISDQRMVQAAISIISECGVGGLKLTEVGTRAGYSRGLASMRFGSVGGLLRSVAGHLSKLWVSELQAAVAEKTGLAALFAALDANAHYLEPPVSTSRVQFLILFHSMDPSVSDHLDVARVLAAQRRDMAGWIHQAVQNGEVHADIDPQAEAMSIVGSLNGIIFQSLIDPTLPWKSMWARLRTEITERLIPKS